MSSKSSRSALKKTAVASLLAFTAAALGGCSHSQEVKCYGVSAQGSDHWIGMPEGECAKLADSHAQPLSSDEVKQVTHYAYSDYVKCYGVAAAGMNDCATKSTACGGSVSVPKAKDAWIAIPKGICEQLEDGVVGKVK